MKCPKCKGLTEPEQTYDFVRTATLWRCVICGERIDPVILTNRERSQSCRSSA